MTRLILSLVIFLLASTLVACPTPREEHVKPDTTKSGVKEVPKKNPDPAEAKKVLKVGTNVNVADELKDENTAMDQKGCPFVAADGSAFACWHLTLDMGFGEQTLRFYDPKTPGKFDSIEVFGRTDGEDDWVIRKKGVSEAQSRMKKRSLQKVKWSKVGEEKRHEYGSDLTLAKGKSVKLPSLGKDASGKCCKWKSTEFVSKDTRHKLVRAYGDCDWVDKPGDACHVEGYNDESYSFKERWFLLKK